MKTPVLLSLSCILTISSCHSTEGVNAQAADAVRAALNNTKFEKTFAGGQTLILGYSEGDVIVAGRFPINWGSKPLAQK